MVWMKRLPFHKRSPTPRTIRDGQEKFLLDATLPVQAQHQGGNRDDGSDAEGAESEFARLLQLLDRLRLFEAEDAFRTVEDAVQDAVPHGIGDAGSHGAVYLLRR